MGHVKFTNEFRQRFPNKLVNKYECYEQAVHPFTIDRELLYWSGWTEEEATAMKLLKDRGIIPAGTKCQVRVHSISNKREFISDEPVCNVPMAERYNGYPWPDAVFFDDAIQDQQLRADLLGWCVGASKHRVIRDAIREYVNHAVSAWHGINTPGQLFRIWPEIACMMPGKYSHRVMGQKLRSSLPESWGEEKVEDFRTQPYFDEINQAFMAMSLMELDREDSKYPSVS